MVAICPNGTYASAPAVDPVAPSVIPPADAPAFQEARDSVVDLAGIDQMLEHQFGEGFGTQRAILGSIRACDDILQDVDGEDIKVINLSHRRPLGEKQLRPR